MNSFKFTIINIYVVWKREWPIFIQHLKQPNVPFIIKKLHADCKEHINFRTFLINPCFGVWNCLRSIAGSTIWELISGALKCSQNLKDEAERESALHHNSKLSHFSIVDIQQINQSNWRQFFTPSHSLGIFNLRLNFQKSNRLHFYLHIIINHYYINYY